MNESMQNLGTEESTVLLNEALNRLKLNFMTMLDLERAGVAKELVIEEGVWGYDWEFMMKYPDHPMGEGRFTRIHGADQVMVIAKKRACPFSESVLEQLHVSLFDCCASVRHSIAIALFSAGDASSIPFLETMLEQETESKMVREAAATSLKHLRNIYITS